MKVLRGFTGRSARTRTARRGPDFLVRGQEPSVDALSFLALAALLVGMVIALTQKVWPVALLCLGLLLSVLAEAGLIVS